MNDNQHTTRLHVSSAGAEDTSVVRFSLPSGVSNVESVKIMEAEIVNALTPIHDGNDTVYFNEFECKVTYKNNSNTGTKLFGVTLPTLTFTSRMFEARIPHQSYSLDAQLSATEKAMNTPRAVYSSLSENLHTVNPQNTYTVMRQPGSNSLRPLITAVTSASGDYSTHTQVQYAGPSSAFAVRRGNMPLLALKSTNAIWNPYGADIAVDNTDYSSDKFDQPWHCSPFRVIIDLGKDHRFIPGDPVALAFDALAGTAATISSITASTNSFTLDAIGDLTLGDTVKYNSTGAAINGLTNNVLYEIASVSGNIVTLTNVTTDAARPEGSHTLTPIGVYKWNGARGIYDGTDAASALDGFVAYVNGPEVHVLLLAHTKTKTTLVNCAVRLRVGADISRCIQLGIGADTRQGLLVCSRTESASGTLLSEVLVHANAAADYMAFKYEQSTLPFASGGIVNTLGLVESHFDVTGTAAVAATISSITASTNSFTLDAIGDLTKGDTVKYNSTGAAINGLANNVLYEIASVSGNIVTLTNVTTDAARPEGSHTLTPIVRPITLTPMTGAGRAYSAACADNFHFLQYGSQILFTNKQDNTTTMTTKSVIVEDPQVDGIVPRIGFLGPVGLTNPGRIIWTIPSATPEEHHVGHSCVFATEDMDITQGARVVMLELEAVGIGPIGNLHVTGCDKVFFGRAQLKSGYLALMLTDQDGYVGQYDFDNYVSPREMIVRLYTEAGRPYNTHGTHNSYLFEFKTVGSHSGCVRVL